MPVTLGAGTASATPAKSRQAAAKANEARRMTKAPLQCKRTNETQSNGPVATGQTPGGNMTRIVIGLLAAIALLFVIVLARTEMTAAPPAQTSTSPLSFNIDPRGIAAHLAQAVRFQTVSYSAGVSEDEKIQALDAMRAWMEKTDP